MEPGFPPLDEQLHLRPGSTLTPWLVDSIVRLGTRLPFSQVPELVAHFTGVTVSAETVRRLTEQAGRAAVAVATAAVDRLEQTRPLPPPGPAVSTTDLSYLSRLTDAETFGRLATDELHRRGTSRAGTVVAITDGAAWCQGFIDLHRHDAVRVLDFAHALEHLGQVAQAVFGSGTEGASAWLGVQAHALRHGREAAVLAALTALATAPERDEETRRLLTGTHAYLANRRAHIRYQAFVAAGYPIGSGCVESANKLVVEARLKGAGMHWARANVTPMLALRTLAANARWTEDWPAIWDRLRHPPRNPIPAAPPLIAALVPVPPAPMVPDPPPAPRPKLVIDGKPTADHPWRKASPFRAK